MSRLADQARTYIGTPWKHRGRNRKGMDCGGLPWRCYADLGMVLPDLARYGRDPFKDGLMKALQDALGPPVWTGSKGSCPRYVLAPGQVVVMAPDALPRHVGIVGEDDMYGLCLIHADSTIDVKRVNVQGLEDPLVRLIVAVFYRAVE